ncbi:MULTISPECIES: hypothetical protein [Paenibacillus]|uniref:DUF5668 domain-containing protein n=1 Tax=Paenibacillus cineris TaxID=237530 RepID=A0ABQ4LGC3_9BACL|nr:MULTISPECIES: hypothetical protein [Paenibacillus]OXL84927.1 hypothetical protein BCV73_18855 [Paenibacillus sp. SSG-1]GIO55597.1 hypothetical protein J21TS7_39150 [Paenibacillus cineris]
MSSRNDLKLGLFIVIAGIVILLGKLGVFGFLGRTLWPLVLLIPGLVLHMLFFGNRARATVLVPGGILTVYGLLFLLCSTISWGLMSYLWPALLLGIAVGLYEYYLFEKPRPSSLLPASVILGLASLVLFFISLLHTAVIYILAVLLIALGIWLIAGRGKSRNRKWKSGW